MNALNRVLLLLAALALAAAACGPAGRITTRDYNRFALKAQEEGLWAEAEYRLRQALAVTPDDARLHNNLGVALEAQGKLAEAHAAYKEAVRLNPYNPTYQRNLHEFTVAHHWEYDADISPPATADTDD